MSDRLSSDLGNSNSDHMVQSQIISLSTEIQRLKRELEKLHISNVSVVKERDEWSTRCQRERQEIFRLKILVSRLEGATTTTEQKEISTYASNRPSLHNMTGQQHDTVRLQDGTSQLQRLTSSLSNGASSRSETFRGRSAQDEMLVLREQVADLSRENRQLRELHEATHCETYAKPTIGQLEDAQTLQKAAELEIEGLRHLEEANSLLHEQNTALNKQVVGLVTEKYKLDATVADLMQCAERYSAQLNNAHSRIGELEDAVRFSQCQLLQPSPTYNSSDYDSADGNDAVSEFSTSVASSRDEDPSVLARKELLQADVLELSGIHCLESAPQSILTYPLKKSEVQSVETSPQDAKYDYKKDPEFAAKLDDLGKYIMGLSSMPGVSSIPQDRKARLQSLQDSKKKLNVALMITIKQSDNKSKTLLQRIQSVVSNSSTLDIQGPKQDVKNFVDGLHRTDADHKEKIAAATKWQNVAQERLSEVEALRTELKNRPRCVIHEHKYLKDELDAKDVQYQMTEKLLAEFKKKERAK
ncbi:hypothetical protein ACN47E_009371 [Coniothyrium glycines]